MKLSIGKKWCVNILSHIVVVSNCLQVGPQHEFLVFQVYRPEDTTFWVRVERSTRWTKRWGRLRRGSSPTTETKDTVRIYSDRSALFPATSSINQPEILARLRYAETCAPHLKNLCALLSFIVDVSPSDKEQCYWFCSSITEIIWRHFPRARLIQDPAFGNQRRYGTFSAPQADDMQNEVDRRLREWLAIMGMPVEIWAFCELKYLSSRQ